MTVPQSSIDIVDADAAGLHRMSRNPSVEKYTASYRSHQVPYIEIYKVPVDENNQQVYPISDSTDGPMIVERHPGPFRWELSLDSRWAYDYDTKEEIEALIPLLADAMAVAAGYACHGSNNRLNPHGPTLLGAHNDTPGGEVTFG